MKGRYKKSETLGMAHIKMKLRLQQPIQSEHLGGAAINASSRFVVVGQNPKNESILNLIPFFNYDQSSNWCW